MGRPSFGRSKAERGLDQFDSPPAALNPLLVHEPLLAGVRAVAEPFAGAGNLVTAMRERGIVVHASDIVDRGCADSAVLDFFDMDRAPCDTLISNPPYASATDCLEHAWAQLRPCASKWAVKLQRSRLSGRLPFHTSAAR